MSKIIGEDESIISEMSMNEIPSEYMKDSGEKLSNINLSLN